MDEMCVCDLLCWRGQKLSWASMVQRFRVPWTEIKANISFDNDLSFKELIVYLKKHNIDENFRMKLLGKLSAKKTTLKIYFIKLQNTN